MASSTSSLQRKRPRIRAIAAGVLVGILLWDTSAWAINALVSQDLPLLVQIAATEASSYTELGAILSEAAAITAEVKEYTSIAKTAWGALNELRQMSWEDFENATKQGLNSAFPELGGMYRDVKDIRNLDYRDPRAFDTLRGILWESAYGPAIDYLHSGHEDYEAIAAMQDHRGREANKVALRRMEAQQWEEDCKRTSNDGQEGACQAAANRAAIQSSLMLQDIHESSLYSLEAQEKLIANEDRKELDEIYGHDRLIYDLRNYVLSASGVEGSCTAGNCLYETYGNAMWKHIAQYRSRHLIEYPKAITGQRSTP
jgi:hypothetical protein